MEFFKELELKEVSLEDFSFVENTYFKTLHGMLYRYASTASSLPFNPATLESNILPFMLEPPLPKSYLAMLSKNTQSNLRVLTLQSKELQDTIKECIVKTAHKLGVYDNTKINEVVDIVFKILSELQNNYKYLTYYQYTYLLEMFKAWKDDRDTLTIISSPTGSGKTLIFLFYVLIKVLVNKLLGSKLKAIIIYPRKALARDQLERIIEACYIVNRVLIEKGVGLQLVVGIRDGDSLNIDSSKLKPQKFKSLREIFVKKEGKQYKLYHGIDEYRNYRVFLADEKYENIYVEEVTWLKDMKKSGDEWSYLAEYDIVITNHSILHKLSNSALLNPQTFINIVSSMGIIVIDEAHVYAREDLEILATSLLKLFYTRARLRKNSEPTSPVDLVSGLDIIMSSATLTDQQIISKNNAKIFTGNIIGFFKLKTTCIDKHSPSSTLSEFLASILSEKILDVYRSQGKLVYLDYDCAVNDDLGIRKDDTGQIIWRYPYRVKTGLVIIPYPHRKSWTTLLEVLITLMHWLNSARTRLEKFHNGFSKISSLVFVDSRATLKDLYEIIIKRFILEAQDHVDRVLFTGDYRYDQYAEIREGKRVERERALKQIVEFINKLTERNRIPAYQLIYGETDITEETRILGDFNVVPLYVTLKDIVLLRKTTVENYVNLLDKVLKNLSHKDNIINFIKSSNEFARQIRTTHLTNPVFTRILIMVK